MPCFFCDDTGMLWDALRQRHVPCTMHARLRNSDEEEDIDEEDE